MSIHQALQIYTSPSSNQQQLKEAELFLNNCESHDLVRYISELGSCFENNTNNNNNNSNNSSIVKLCLVLLGNAIKVDKLLHHHSNNNFDFINALSNICRETVQEKILGNLVFGGNSVSLLSNGIISRSCARCLLMCDNSTIETTLRKIVESTTNSTIFFSSSFVSTLYQEIIATGFAALKYIEEQEQNNNNSFNNAVSSHFLNAVPTCLFFIREHIRNQVLPQLLEGFQKQEQPWNGGDNNQRENFFAMTSSIKTCFNILTSIWLNAPSNDDDDDGNENNQQQQSSSTKKEKYHALAQFAKQDISDFVLPFLKLLLDTKNEFRQKFSTDVVTGFAFHQLQNNILSVLHSAVDVFHPDLVLETLLSRENSVSTVQNIFAESLLAQSLNDFFFLTTSSDDESSEFPNRSKNNSSSVLLLQQELILRSVTTTLRIIFTIMAQSGSGCQGNPQFVFNSNANSILPCCLRHAFLNNQTLIRNCFCHLVTLRPFFENVLSSIDSNNNNNNINNNSIEREAKNICDDLDLTPSEVLSPIIDMVEFLANSESKRRNGFGSGDSRNYFNENNKSKKNFSEEDVHKMIERRERETEEKQRHQQHKSNNSNFSNDDDDDDDIQRDEKILTSLHQLFSNNNKNASKAAAHELQEKCLSSIRRDFLALCVEAQKLSSVFVSQAMKLEEKCSNNSIASSCQSTAQNLQNWLKETFEETMSSSSPSSSKSEITLLGVLFALPLCFSLSDEATWISVVETVLLASSSKNISSCSSEMTASMVMTQHSIILASFISIYSPFSGSNTNKMIKKMMSKSSKNNNGKDIFTACMEKLCGENLLNLFGTSIRKGIDTLVEFSAKSSASPSAPLTILNSFSIQMILSSLLAKAIDTFLLFTVKFSFVVTASSSKKTETQFPLPLQIQQLLQQNSSTLVNFLFSSQNINNENNNNNISTPPFLVHLLQTFERNIPLSINPLHCWNSLTRSIAIATNLINNNNNNNNSNNANKASSSSPSSSSSDLTLLPRIFETLQSSLFSCWKNELGRADVAELAEELATKFLAWIPINNNNKNISNEDESRSSAALFFNIYWLRDNILSELLSAKEQGRDNSAVACLTPFAIRIVSETVAVRGSTHLYAAEAGKTLYGHLCVACILSSAARETAVVQAAGSCLANLLEGVVITSSSSSSSLSLPMVSLPTFWIQAFENSFLTAKNSNDATMRIDQVTFCTIMTILRPEMLIHASSGMVFANAKFYELNLFKLTSLIVQYCNLVEISISSPSTIEENTIQQQQQMVFHLFSTMTNICSKSISTDLCFQPAALAWLRTFLVAPSQLFSASSPDQQQQCADILKRLSKLSLIGPDGIDTLVKITKSISIQDVFSIVTRIVQRIIIMRNNNNSNQDESFFTSGFLNSTAFKVKSKSSCDSNAKKRKNSKSSATFNNVSLIQALSAMSGAMFGALIDVCLLKNKNSSNNNDDEENYNNDDENDENYQDGDDDDDEGDENNNYNNEQQRQENEEDDDEDDDEDEDSALSALDDSLLQILVANNNNNLLLLNDSQLQQLHQLFQEWRTNVGSQQESMNAMESLVPKKMMTIIRNTP